MDGHSLVTDSEGSVLADAEQLVRQIAEAACCKLADRFSGDEDHKEAATSQDKEQLEELARQRDQTEEARRSAMSQVYDPVSTMNFTWATSKYKQLKAEDFPVSDLSQDRVRQAVEDVCCKLADRFGGDEDHKEAKRAAKSQLGAVDATRKYMMDNGLHFGITPQQLMKFDAKLLWTAPLLEDEPDELEGFVEPNEIRDIRFNGRRYEFCTVLNLILRMNDEELLRAAMPIIAALNLHCAVTRARKAPNIPWGDFTFYRGGGFNPEFKPFFQEGLSYRSVGFLATTPTREVTQYFLGRVTKPLEPTMWVFHVDSEKKCWHLNYMDASQIIDVENKGKPKEDEFLFAPFSAFRIRSVCWREDPWDEPHVIEVDAYPDNQKAPPDLPLAPWQ